jgi:hypothetical protein
MSDQLALFDVVDDDPELRCGCGANIPLPGFPGTDGVIECLKCNHRRNLMMMIHYVKYGRPGGGKHPGMLFPGQRQGDGEPTAAQRAAAMEC